MLRSTSLSLSCKNEVPKVGLSSYIPRGILNREGLPLARGVRLPSLRSPRDLTLGGVSKESNLQNSPAVKEGGLDSANDSSRSGSHNNVGKLKPNFGTGSKSSLLLLRSLENRSTGKCLKNYKSYSRNEEDGNIGPAVINDVEIKCEALSRPQENILKVLKPPPRLIEKQFTAPVHSNACESIIPDVAKDQNETVVTIKKDPSLDEPLALKEVKTELLEVEFESIITVECNEEPKSECLPPVLPTADQPFNSSDDTLSTEIALPIQSPEEPKAELDIGTKLPERLHSLKSHGPENLQNSCGNQSYKYNVCQKKFSNLRGLANHSKIHTEDLDKYSVMHLGKWSYMCNVCQKVFSIPGNLKRHLNIHFGINKCETCNKSFKQKYDLILHKKSHSREHPFRCEICTKGFFSSGTLKNHSCTPIAAHKCGICHQTFKHNYKLRIHDRTHSGEKPFHCEICQRTFTHSEALKNHLRFHTGERPYKCEVCSSAFSQRSNLKTHIRIHTGEKSFNCDLCNMRFNRSYKLRIHLLIHTGERPHKCKLCGKCFCTTSQLGNHVAQHSTVRTHICKVCNKGFILASNLRAHFLTHTENKSFMCEVCGRCFRTSKKLNMHVKTHSVTRIFFCKICNRSYKTSSVLKKHARIHRLEKHFVCDVCNKVFHRPDDLESHHPVHIK